jgi:hypothetical protein
MSSLLCSPFSRRIFSRPASDIMFAGTTAEKCSDSSSTLVVPAAEGKKAEKETADTGPRLEDLRALMAKEGLDY